MFRMSPATIRRIVAEILPPSNMVKHSGKHWLYHAARGIKDGYNAYNRYKDIAGRVSALRHRVQAAHHKHVTSHEAQHHETVQQNSDGGHSIRKSHTYRYKKNYLMAKTVKNAPPNCQLGGSAGIFTNAVGIQEYTQLSTNLDKVQLDTLLAYVPTSESRLWVENMEFYWDFANACNVPITVKFFTVRPKEDTAVSAVQAIQNGYQARYGSVNSWKTLYFNPNGSADFRRNWKIVDCKELLLSPGAVHKHQQMFDVKMWYDTRAQNGGNTFFKHMTYQTFALIYGSPVKGTAGVVTLSASECTYTANSKLKYRYPAGAAATAQVNTVLSTVPNTITTPQFMEEDTGAPTAYTQV